MSHRPRGEQARNFRLPYFARILSVNERRDPLNDLRRRSAVREIFPLSRGLHRGGGAAAAEWLELNGIVKAASSAARAAPASCSGGFCRSMEKFVTMEWNEEELNRRKRIVTSFAEVVTTPRAASASAPRKEGRRGKVNFCPVNQ